MRLFLSIDLPDVLADDVATVQDRFSEAYGLSFTDPEQAHVTMKFLGDTDESRVDEIVEATETAVADADVAPFQASVEGLGVFPSLDYISVVWAGVDEGTEEMVQLHEAIEDETTALGFEAEEHNFSPHVTIARMNDARGKELVQQEVRESHPTVGAFTVDEVRLKESTLTDEGPKYETIESISL